MHQGLEDRVVRFALFVLDVRETIDDSRGGEPAVDEIRPQLRHLASEVAAAAAEPEAGRLAQAALVIWADELLTTSRWKRAADWRTDSLEHELLGTSDGSWRFFEQAETSRRLGHVDALEVFALCGQLGFRGVYRVGLKRAMRTIEAASPNVPVLAAKPKPQVVAEGGLATRVRPVSPPAPPIEWPPRRSRAEVLRELPPSWDAWASSTFRGVPTWHLPQRRTGLIGRLVRVIARVFNPAR